MIVATIMAPTASAQQTATNQAAHWTGHRTGSLDHGGVRSPSSTPRKMAVNEDIRRLTPALTRDDGGRQAAGDVVVERLVRQHGHEWIARHR